VALDRTERALTIGKVAQANAALHDLDPGLGLSLLDGCRPDTRFWEYDYTRRLCNGAPLILHGRDDRIYRAVFSPDGRWIASTGDLTITIWDARTGVEQWRVKTHVDNLVFSPDSRRIAGSAFFSTWRIWDVSTGKELVTPPDAKLQMTSPLLFSPDGEWLAGCCQTEAVNRATVWNAQTAKVKFAVPTRPFEGWYRVHLDYAPGATSLLIHDGETVQWLDPLTGKEQRKVAAKGRQGQFSPDGSRIALEGDRGTVHILNLDSEQVVHVPVEPNAVSMNAGGAMTDLQFSPDGRRLAGAWWDRGCVRLFDATTGAALGAFFDGGQVMSMSFSPDGQRLAVVNSGHSPTTCTLEVWNVRDLTEGLTLRGHSDSVLDLAFAPDGRKLLTVANLPLPAAPSAGDYGQSNGYGGLGGVSSLGNGFGGGLGGGPGVQIGSPSPPTFGVGSASLDSHSSFSA
jgi:WD40 repeat protein